jgi:hypothetical protein
MGRRFSSGESASLPSRGLRAVRGQTGSRREQPGSEAGQQGGSAASRTGECHRGAEAREPVRPRRQHRQDSVRGYYPDEDVSQKALK